MKLAAAPYAWTVSGGDATRRGFFPGQTTPRRKTRELKARGAVQASVVIDEHGRLYVADMAGWVRGFEASGTMLWEAKVQGAISASPALEAGRGRIFVGTHLGFAYALETATGKVVWSKEILTKTDPRILSDILFWDVTRSVVLSSWGERFVALDAKTGRENLGWEAGLFPVAAASADQQGNVYSLRVLAGRGLELARVNAEGREDVLLQTSETTRGAKRTSVAAAVVADPERGVGFLVENRERASVVHAVDLRSGERRWSQALPSSVQATPALNGHGQIWIPDLSGQVHIIKADTGTIDQSLPTSTEYLLAGGVCDGAGACYVGTPTGEILRCEGTRTTVIHTADRGFQARPSFGRDGTLWIPGTNRIVYGFGG